jgi:hypothetical protein
MEAGIKTHLNLQVDAEMMNHTGISRKCAACKAAVMRRQLNLTYRMCPEGIRKHDSPSTFRMLNTCMYHCWPDCARSSHECMHAINGRVYCSIHRVHPLSKRSCQQQLSECGLQQWTQPAE